MGIYHKGKRVITTSWFERVIVETDTFEAIENNTLTEYKSTIKNFKQSMFSGCTSLVTLDLPNVTSVAMNGCTGCINLKTVKLASAGTLNGYCFQNCTSLKDLWLGYGSIVTLAHNTEFMGCSGVTIHVRPNVLDQYQNATNWVSLVNNGTVTIVGDYRD